MTDIQDEVARMASCAVDALHGHPAGALDFSRKSLEVIEAALAEAAPYHSEIPRDQSRTLVQQFGCYVLEVARREFGGALPVAQRASATCLGGRRATSACRHGRLEQSARSFGWRRGRKYFFLLFWLC